mmetsp:Transcript_34345/g.39125  ORF Transcript_34345/g.39125 Transcript_34345/m.39125 type:complete len:183 (+) Transcript_34345:141-689(+)
MMFIRDFLSVRVVLSVVVVSILLSSQGIVVRAMDTISLKQHKDDSQQHRQLKTGALLEAMTMVNNRLFLRGRNDYLYEKKEEERRHLEDNLWSKYKEWQNNHDDDNVQNYISNYFGDDYGNGDNESIWTMFQQSPKNWNAIQWVIFSVFLVALFICCCCLCCIRSLFCCCRPKSSMVYKAMP